MKIKADLLLDFVRKVSLNGMIEGSIYVAKDEGIEVISRELSNMAITKGLLKKQTYQECEVGTRFPIRDNKRLMDCLKQFGKNEVELWLQDNSVCIRGKSGTGSLLVDLKMVDESLLDNKLEQLPENLKFENPVKIESRALEKIGDHTALLKQQVVTLEAVDKKLKITEFNKF